MIVQVYVDYNNGEDLVTTMYSFANVKPTYVRLGKESGQIDEQSAQDCDCVFQTKAGDTAAVVFKDDWIKDDWKSRENLLHNLFSNTCEVQKDSFEKFKEDVRIRVGLIFNVINPDWLRQASIYTFVHFGGIDPREGYNRNLIGANGDNKDRVFAISCGNKIPFSDFWDWDNDRKVCRRKIPSTVVAINDMLFELSQKSTDYEHLRSMLLLADLRSDSKLKDSQLKDSADAKLQEFVRELNAEGALNPAEVRLLEETGISIKDLTSLYEFDKSVSKIRAKL